MGISRNLAIGVAAVALLYGCSRSSPGTSGGVASGSIATKKPVKPGDGLVSAIPANKTTLLPLQVKFELLDRPKLGDPVEMDLVYQPTSNMVDRVFGKVEAEDGLELVEGAQIAPVTRPVEGTALHHTIKLLPKRDGLFTVNATLSVESGADTSTQTYAMPIIAGAGLPAQPAKTQSPPPPAATTTAAVAPKTATTPTK